MRDDLMIDLLKPWASPKRLQWMVNCWQDGSMLHFGFKVKHVIGEGWKSKYLYDIIQSLQYMYGRQSKRTRYEANCIFRNICMKFRMPVKVHILWFHTQCSEESRCDHQGGDSDWYGVEFFLLSSSLCFHNL